MDASCQTSEYIATSTTTKAGSLWNRKNVSEKAHVVKQIMKATCERIQIPKMKVFSDVFGNIFGE